MRSRQLNAVLGDLFRALNALDASLIAEGADVNYTEGEEAGEQFRNVGAPLRSFGGSDRQQRDAERAEAVDRIAGTSPRLWTRSEKFRIMRRDAEQVETLERWDLMTSGGNRLFLSLKIEKKEKIL